MIRQAASSRAYLARKKNSAATYGHTTISSKENILLLSLASITTPPRPKTTTTTTVIVYCTPTTGTRYNIKLVYHELLPFRGQNRVQAKNVPLLPDPPGVRVFKNTSRNAY